MEILKAVNVNKTCTEVRAANQVSIIYVCEYRKCKQESGTQIWPIKRLEKALNGSESIVLTLTFSGQNIEIVALCWLGWLAWLHTGGKNHFWFQ